MLKIVNISDIYLNYLSNVDNRVPKEHINSKRRPFAGVLLTVDRTKYFAPLSSPKPKHKRLSNKSLDVFKLKDGELGIVNLNNMIPVCDKAIIEFDINNLPDKDIKDMQYKVLLQEQVREIRKHEIRIIKKAKILYQQVVYKKCSDTLLLRCCDFIKLEAAAKAYQV